MLSHNTLRLTYLVFVATASLILFSSCQSPSPETTTDTIQWVVQARAGDRYAMIDTEGQTIIPNGRIIQPLGTTYQVAPHPYGLVMSDDGSIVISANSGTSPFSITIFQNPLAGNPQIKQVPEGAKNDEDLLGAVFMGLAISPDNQTVYVAGGQQNKIYLFDIASGQPKGEINCGVTDANGKNYTNGYIGDMVLSEDGNTLYAVDQIGFRLITIDLINQSILRNTPVGRYPFGVALSPDESEIYVANVGMFEYKPIVGEELSSEALKEQGLRFPATAYGSPEMKEGIQNDSMSVPALGDPNVDEAFSVWTVDATSGKVAAKVKTGFLVGQVVEGFPAVGGASPNSLVATDDFVFVSNGNNDCVSVIDIQQDTVVQNIRLQPDKRLGNLRGIIPFGLALSPDRKRLYVAEAGINAVGVIDVATQQVLGHLPVGWFPSKLAVSPDGKQLVVANAKGYGSGPNGGSTFELGDEGSFIGALMKGSITVLDIPADEELEATTRQVVENNFVFKEASSIVQQRADHPVPVYPGERVSPIKHIVFVSKENRTYDEVFGQLENGKGEASLARYGRDQTFSNNANTQTVENATVMPNHLALAERFAISDNFYVDADHSADGHRWLVSTYPNEWVETHVAAAYGGKRRSVPGSEAPGNYGVVGSSGAIYPEDYNEAGSIWDHFDRNNIDFYNFGFGVELANSYADSTLKYFGVRPLVNYPIPGPLYDRTSRAYATYNMGIPDQFRVDTFIDEFEEKWGDDGLPAVLTVILPNDHGAGDRPNAGYPFKESYMADNDLALGRLVEFLSNTSYWNEMAIIVTEDDSQDGVDHVDAHRSLLMVISPYAKKNYIGHQHYSFGSIFKTFWHILGTPYLNHYDFGATDLADLFTAEPDTSAYKALSVNPLVFDPQKALDPFDEQFDWKAVLESPQLDDP
ncbi:MAG: alkaline phosphatase family protein, partial [Tunicatimonas sp.]|uniref:bifunctional YncE family protein/alkaline phosphatase family protein n=1 Tax=Tunicatimonas sp. TaxID=1940096 RepID=UPI003C73911B